MANHSDEGHLDLYKDSLIRLWNSSEPLIFTALTLGFVVHFLTHILRTIIRYILREIKIRRWWIWDDTRWKAVPATSWFSKDKVRYFGSSWRSLQWRQIDLCKKQVHRIRRKRRNVIPRLMYKSSYVNRCIERLGFHLRPGVYWFSDNDKFGADMEAVFGIPFLLPAQTYRSSYIRVVSAKLEVTDYHFGDPHWTGARSKPLFGPEDIPPESFHQLYYFDGPEGIDRDAVLDATAVIHGLQPHYWNEKGTSPMIFTEESAALPSVSDSKGFLHRLQKDYHFQKWPHGLCTNFVHDVRLAFKRFGDEKAAFLKLKKNGTVRSVEIRDSWYSHPFQWLWRRPRQVYGHLEPSERQELVSNALRRRWFFLLRRAFSLVTGCIYILLLIAYIFVTVLSAIHLLWNIPSYWRAVIETGKNAQHFGIFQVLLLFAGLWYSPLNIVYSVWVISFIDWIVYGAQADVRMTRWSGFFNGAGGVCWWFNLLTYDPIPVSLEPLKSELLAHGSDPVKWTQWAVQERIYRVIDILIAEEVIAKPEHPCKGIAILDEMKSVTRESAVWDEFQALLRLLEVQRPETNPFQVEFRHILSTVSMTQPSSANIQTRINKLVDGAPKVECQHLFIMVKQSHDKDFQEETMTHLQNQLTTHEFKEFDYLEYGKNRYSYQDLRNHELVPADFHLNNAHDLMKLTPYLVLAIVFYQGIFYFVIPYI